MLKQRTNTTWVTGIEAEKPFHHTNDPHGTTMAGVKPLSVFGPENHYGNRLDYVACGSLMCNVRIVNHNALKLAPASTSGSFLPMSV